MVVVGLVVAAVASVVVAAVQADGRTSVRAQTNDGGAWLVRRSDGIVGHLNRAAGEVSGVVRVADPGSSFDVEQADDIVLVHDADAAELQVVDPRTYQSVNTVTVPLDVQVRAIAGGAVLWQPEPLRVWRLGRDDLGAIVRLDDVAPTMEATGAGLVTTTFDGAPIVLDVKGQRIGLGATDIAQPWVWTDIGPTATAVRSLGAIGRDIVMLLDDGAVARLDDGSSESITQTAPNEVEVAVLAQPSPADTPLLAVTTDGSILVDVGMAAPSGSGTAPGSDAATDLRRLAEIGAAEPLAPIVHDGCVFNVGTAPPTFTRICNGAVDQTEALVGADPSALRIRLVNDWIWINDLTSGALWIAGADTELERIDDWGSTLGSEGDDPDDNPGDESEGETEENPDIGEIRDPEIDEDGINEPPVARDDVARTRTDQPVVIDVVANDEDPDGDALMVSALSGEPDGVAVDVTDDQGSVQVVPPPGFTGDISFSYTVSDGRGASADARVTTEVVSPDASNRPPVAETDVAEVRGGASAAFNVLNNDSDPDGDTFVLSSVEVPSGGVVFDPSGEVNFTPDPTSRAGTIELGYQIVDSFGATANGTVRVAIRLDTSNNEPRAVNDSASTVVGMPVTLNVLKNDADPDNDPLTVAGLPQLVASTGNQNALDEISLSDDGEFFFLPTVAGDYVFLYAIIDGSERDAAYIRVRVEEATENRPPTAIRDDVTISRGDARNVYVLENDTDADGDVIGIVDWSAGAGLEIEQVLGFAFRVTVLPDAPARSQFTYTISDGRGDPSTGMVVVAVSDNDTPDQPPVARPDTLEVRPGQTASARVLVNDYDPEGGALRVVGVSEVPGAQMRVGPGGQEVFVSVDAATVSSFTFGYDVADEAGNQTGSLVQVRLVPIGNVNRPPVARPDVARTVSGRPIDIPVLANDSDPDGDAIQIETIAAQPTFGTAEVGLDGTIRYSPRLGESGSDRLRYTVVDANGDRAVGEVIIGVLPADGVNRAPTATNDTYSMIAGSDVQVLDVLVNDSDPDGDPITITAVDASSDAVAIDPQGAVVFEPPTDLAGAASVDVSFTYDIADGRGGADSALVTIEVVESTVPISPIAVDDIAGPAPRGVPVTVDVLANDSDPDGRVADLTVRSTDPLLPITPDGLLTIADPQETVRVRYTLTDVSGLESSAQVTLIVLDNVAPGVATLRVTTPFETAIPLALAVQATDRDNDDLTFSCCAGVRGGSVTVVESSSNVMDVEFVPDPGFAGVGGFSYLADDQEGHTVSGAVEVTVQPPANTAPVATDGTLEAEAGVPTPVALAGFVEDPDLLTGDVLSFELDARGAPVERSGDTAIVTPPINAAGSTYTIGYTVTDTQGATSAATVTVTVTEPNVPAPTAVADRASTSQGTGVSLSVLTNDIDPLARGLTIVGANVTDGSGTASVVGSEIVYQPDAGYFGATSFTYTIQDARRTAAGQGVGTVNVTVVGRPGAPATPQATADNATATVTWGLPPANGAPITAVELQPEGLGSISLGVTSSHTLTGLENGRPYRFQVRAQNEAGWSEWSGWSAAVTPNTIPGRVPTPSVTFGDGQLSVAWQAPPNEGSAVTGYEIEIGGGRNEVLARGTATSYVWDGLANGTNYQFRIVAVNTAGRSDPSPWSDPEHPLREPGAAGTPDVQRGNRYLDLGWAASPNNGDPVIEYQVRMQSNPNVWVPVGNTTTYRWSDLPNGVTQQFQVRSRNRDLDWSAPSGVSAAVKPCAVPDAPAAPSATGGDLRATVNYTLPGDQGCAISQTQIEASGGGTQTAAGSPHVFTGLANGTTYTFRARSQNEEGWGAWSAASNPVTPAGLPQGPGSITSSNTAVGEVTLGWPDAFANGTPLTRYELSINNGAPIDAALRTTNVQTRLANGQTYSFRVRACNGVGCGPWSPSTTITTWGTPDQPGAPNASGGDGSISASWNAPAANGRPIDRYTVEHDSGGNKDVGGTSTSWNVANNASYQVRVRACNIVGCSPWSAWSQQVRAEAPPPPVQVSANYYGNAQGQAGCSTAGCTYVRIVATGLAANTTYTVACVDAVRGPFSASARTSDGNGRLVDDPACWYGYNNEFYATVGPHRSNTLPPR